LIDITFCYLDNLSNEFPEENCDLNTSLEFASTSGSTNPTPTTLYDPEQYKAGRHAYNIENY